MEFVFYINSLAGGGAERVMAKLASHLAGRQHRVMLVTQTPISLDQYPVDPRVVRVSVNAGDVSRNLLDAALNNLRRWRRLRQIVRRERPAKVLTFMPTANVLGIWACVGTDTPVIISERVHPPHAGLSRLRLWAQKLSYPRAHTIVVLSALSARWFQDRLRVFNTCVIPNGISLPLPDSQPRLEPASYLAVDDRVVLFVGRLVEQKQPLLALQMFAQAAHQHEQWKLVMIGNGEQADSLQQAARSLGIDNKVIWLSQVGNMQAWYERADIYLSTSKFEGSPNALMEAMACGCASLAFDCPTGPADVIEHNINGLLCELTAHETMRQMLTDLLNNPQQRQQLADAARQLNHSHSDATFYQRWEALLVQDQQPQND